MTSFISMLRGINVSGQKKILMEELRRVYEGLGFTHVKTYVQSGNVIFTSEEQEVATLARIIETQIEQAYGYSVPVLVRTSEDFQRILSSNPYLNGRKEDPDRLHVTFLYRLPTKTEWKPLSNPSNNGDEFSIGEQEIYLFCPNGYGTTKYSNTFFEGKLKITATTRNWKTVNALYNLAIELK